MRGIPERDPVTGRILPRAAGGDGSANAIDPVAAGGEDGAAAREPTGQPARRKRGPDRQPRAASGGAGKAGAKAGTSLDLSTTQSLLQSFHTVAAYFGGPCWLLNDEDAAKYALAVANALRHTDIEVAQKTVDYCNLAGAIVYYEGTRWMAMREAQRRPPPPQRPLAPVFTFSPPPTSPNPERHPPPPDPQAEEGALH